MKYKLFIKKWAQKQLAKIERQYQDRIISFILPVIISPLAHVSKYATIVQGVKLPANYFFKAGSLILNEENGKGKS